MILSFELVPRDAEARRALRVIFEVFDACVREALAKFRTWEFASVGGVTEELKTEFPDVDPRVVESAVEAAIRRMFGDFELPGVDVTKNLTLTRDRVALRLETTPAETTAPFSRSSA